MEVNHILDGYQNSKFFAKYKNTYYSDIILREVFNCEVKLNRLYGLKTKTYEEIHQKNVELMKDLFELFLKDNPAIDSDIFWKMIYSFYIDPDSNAIKQLGNVKCTADGLLSIKRIYRKYGMSEKIVEEYEHCRRVPIFFFPQEKNGINMTRAAVFGDRIDHTLFDIKRYFEKRENGNIEECKLYSAYCLPRTSEWLQEMESFEKLVGWYGIKGVFVNDNYEVYDIEKGDGLIINDYQESYGYGWSESYYNNLKALIDSFMSHNN